MEVHELGVIVSGIPDLDFSNNKDINRYRVMVEAMINEIRASLY